MKLNNLKIGLRINLVLIISVVVIFTALAIVMNITQSSTLNSSHVARMNEHVIDLTNLIDVQI